MALNYTQISAITEKKFIPKLYDNVFDSNPLLQRAKSKFYEKLDGGEKIVVPLNYAQSTSGDWYTGADTLTTTDNESITAAEYQWKQLYENISVTSLDEKKNAGDAGIIKFVKSKVEIAEKSMADKLGIGLYSAGTNAKSIVGLRSIVGTGNTVGGISQTDNSWWQSQVDASTTVTTVAAMNSRWNACSIGNDHPTIITTTRNIYGYYYALLQPQQRFVDSDTVKGGFTSLMFNGVPVIIDSHVPTGYMYFLNEKYLKLFVHKDEDMKFEEFMKPINQNVKVAKIYWMGAFGSSNNRMHGSLQAITG